MSSRLNPYLFFAGTAREAMTFYRDVFGGELSLATFGEFGAAGTPGADGVMHGQLETERGYTPMGADTPPGEEPRPGNSAVSISGDAEDADALRGYWTALSGSGSVTVPLAVQMWGDEFGMCVDRYGVPWMVNIAGAPET